MTLAQLAIGDGIARSSREHWKEFIQVIAGQKNVFRKADIANGLASEKWDIDTFEDLWDTVKHHGLVWWDSNGFHPGELLGAVRGDLGL